MDFLTKIDHALDIGELMLISGAEVHRVEDSVGRLCRAFGAERVDCFIITSSIVVTVYKRDMDSHTETRRITSTANDFHRLDRLNRLSRRICNEGMEEDEIVNELREIRAMKPYPFSLEVVAYAFIAAAFTVFFGGGAIEMLVSGVIGCLLRFVVLFADKTANNVIFAKFISSASLTILAALAVKLSLITVADKVIIGNIMLLIPGLGLTNALRDLFSGDSLAGTLRSLEAVLCAIAIAGGYLMVSLVLGGSV